MIEIKTKQKCCGCTACFNICPRQAIEMKEDFEGFLYPVVNTEKCINCGLCDKVCPIINSKETQGENKAYCLRTKKENDLMNSTSGGFFTPISEKIIEKDGWVFGVGFEENYNICHKVAKTKDELKEFQGSKYIQSYLGKTFVKVKELLDKSNLVLFSGTPCQIEGLKSFLRKDYDNLITVDLICHGVPSPKLWRYYIEYQEKKYNSKVKNVKFRNKTYGYHSGTMKLEFENGKVYYGSARVDFILKSFFKEICSRPSCYECVFKKKNHVSDFTIYDCWSFAKLVNGIKDDDKGYTNVIINSKKGLDFFESIKSEYDYYEVDIDEQIKNDGIMVENCAISHKNRDDYYKELDVIGIEKNIKKFIPITKKDHVLERVKLVLYKLKILQILKKIRGK